MLIIQNMMTVHTTWADYIKINTIILDGGVPNSMEGSLILWVLNLRDTCTELVLYTKMHFIMGKWCPIK